MSSAEKNLESIRGIYKAYGPTGKGDVVKPLMELVSEDVKWAMSYMPSSYVEVSRAGMSSLVLQHAGTRHSTAVGPPRGHS
jgi:hypothetical protein